MLEIVYSGSKILYNGSDMTKFNSVKLRIAVAEWLSLGNKYLSALWSQETGEHLQTVTSNRVIHYCKMEKTQNQHTYLGSM